MGEIFNRLVVKPGAIWIGDGASAPVKIIGTRKTGVAPMTNLTAPANLDADTVTVAELADIVGNLIDKLRAHGLVTT